MNQPLTFAEFMASKGVRFIPDQQLVEGVYLVVISDRARVVRDGSPTWNPELDVVRVVGVRPFMRLFTFGTQYDEITLSIGHSRQIDFVKRLDDDDSRRSMFAMIKEFKELPTDVRGGAKKL